MIKININDKQYKVPQRLTVDQYNTLLQFDWEDQKYYPLIVAKLIGAPIHLLAKAKTEQLTLAVAFAVQLMNERKKCKMKDLDTLLFGEFVDLDVYLSQGLDKHFKDIIDMLVKTEWADEAMWAIDQYAKFRLYTYRQYKVLFGLRDKDIEEAEQEGLADIDRMHVARSWYKVIVHLALDNILNIDKVTEQPLKKALNFMALQKERAMEEQQKQLEQKRKYDLQRTR